MVETQPTLYTSRAEMASIFTTLALDTRVDDDRSETVSASEETLLEECIEEATDIFNAYLLPFYTDTNLALSRWVRRRCSYVACYLLSQRRGNPAQFADRYAAILEEIQRIAKGPGINGNPHIPRIPVRQDNRPSLSNLKIDNRYRRSKIRTDTNTAAGSGRPDQDFDHYPYISDP